MKRPDYRIRISSLMIAVLVVALLGVGIRHMELSRGYMRSSLLHLQLQDAAATRKAALSRGIQKNQGLVASEERLVEYHSDLRWKYDQAARAPWLIVDPDPPEPK